MFWSRKKSKNNEIIKYVYNLITSAERVMPANYTGNFNKYREYPKNEEPRPKTFCVDFPITPIDEYDLAYNPWFIWNNTYKIGLNITHEYLNVAILIVSEDISLGSFIITRLGHGNLISNLSKFIIKKRLESFREKGYPCEEIAKEKKIKDYLENCAYNARNLAQIDDDKKDRRAPIDTMHCTTNPFIYYRILR